MYFFKVYFFSSLSVVTMGTLVSLLFPVAKTTDIRNTYARVCIIFAEQRKKKQLSSSAVRGTYLMYGPVVFAFIPKTNGRQQIRKRFRVLSYNVISFFFSVE